jgi:hypothetical protein
MTYRAIEMERAFVTSAVAADAAAVTEVVAALYGQTAFSQADLEDEWSDIEGLRDAA